MVGPREILSNYLNASRLNRPDRSTPEMYERLFSIGRTLLHFCSPIPEIEFIYSSSRQCECIRILGKDYILYDQYLGQSVNYLNRLFLTIRDAKLSAAYGHKVFSENARRSGLFYDSIVSGLVHYHRDRPRDLPQNKFDLSILESHSVRLTTTACQEIFILAHEIYHLIISQDQLLRLDVRRKVLDAIQLKTAFLAEPWGISETGLIVPKITKTGQPEQHYRDPYFFLPEAAKDENYIDELICDYLSIAFCFTHFLQTAKSVTLVTRAIMLLQYHLRVLRHVDMYAALFFREHRDVPSDISLDLIAKTYGRMQLRCNLNIRFCKNILGDLNAGNHPVVGGLDGILLVDERQLTESFDSLIDDYYKLIYDTLFNLIERIKLGTFIDEIEKSFLSRNQRRGLKKIKTAPILEQIALADYFTGWLGSPPKLLTSAGLSP